MKSKAAILITIGILLTNTGFASQRNSHPTNHKNPYSTNLNTSYQPLYPAAPNIDPLFPLVRTSDYTSKNTRDTNVLLAKMIQNQEEEKKILKDLLAEQRAEIQVLKDSLATQQAINRQLLALMLAQVSGIDNNPLLHHPGLPGIPQPPMPSSQNVAACPPFLHSALHLPFIMPEGLGLSPAQATLDPSLRSSSLPTIPEEQETEASSTKLATDAKGESYHTPVSSELNSSSQNATLSSNPRVSSTDTDDEDLTYPPGLELSSTRAVSNLRALLMPRSPSPKLNPTPKSVESNKSSAEQAVLSAATSVTSDSHNEETEEHVDDIPRPVNPPLPKAFGSSSETFDDSDTETDEEQDDSLAISTTPPPPDESANDDTTTSDFDESVEQ